MNWVSDDEFEAARRTVENCVWSIAAAREAVDADPRVAEWFSRYTKQKRLEMIRATRRLHELGPRAPASDEVMREHEVRLGLPEGTFARTFHEPGPEYSVGLGRTLELAEQLAEAELEVSGPPGPDWGPAIIRICCGTLIGALIGAPLGALAVQENVLKKMIEAAVVGGITAVANELVGPLSERVARSPAAEPEKVVEPEPVPPPEAQVDREPLRELELVRDAVEELDPKPVRQLDPTPEAEPEPVREPEAVRDVEPDREPVREPVREVEAVLVQKAEPEPEAVREVELDREPVREPAREVEPALVQEVEPEPEREPARELIREAEALIREAELELAREAEPEPVGELDPEPVREMEPDRAPELEQIRELEELVQEAEPEPVREPERELELEQKRDIDPPGFGLFRGF